MILRPQYHFRKSPNGYHAWNVARLVKLAKDLPIEKAALSQIAELDEDYWFAGSGEIATCRRIVEHFRLMAEADLRYPIILCARGRLMDGMHRVAKVLFQGGECIDCVRFAETPAPDYIDVSPDELTY